MTEKEKARAYDEALKKARQLCDYPTTKPFISDLQDLFPELKESEDEKIRKILVEAVTQVLQDQYCSNRGVSKEKVVAWLENHAKADVRYRYLDDILIEHIEHGKYYYCIKDYYSGGCKRASKGEVIQALRGMGMMALGVEANEYFIPVKCIVDDRHTWSEEDVYNSKLILSTINQDQDLSLETKDKLTYWLKSLRPQSKQEWKEENIEELTEFENAMMHIGGSFFGENAGLDPNDTAMIKEQAKLLLELVPKQEWSEEDERRINRISDFIWKNRKGDTDEIYQQEQDVNWLKSFIPQKQWKPSNVQMQALKEACDIYWEPDGSDALYTLYEQLKKLTE